MWHLRKLDQQAVQGFAGPRLGITSHADDGTDAERLNHDPEQLITLLVHGRHDLAGQLLRDDISSLFGILKEEQRAVVVDEVLGEERLGFTKALLKQAPESATAYLGAMAGETSDLLGRMLPLRSTDRHLESHPVTDGGNLAERDARLRHAERPGVHPQEEHLPRSRGRKAM